MYWVFVVLLLNWTGANRGHQVVVATKSCVVVGGAQFLWLLRMELISCERSGARNFEVADRFLENLWTFVLNYTETGNADKLCILYIR